ncbi:MAG TPA: TonB family protein [Tepidisphaeraceae bacterium]|nr:TonB family protein [Tepidisphaeraceae bacterium]
MPRRNDASLTIALCLSLIAHAGLALTLIENQTQTNRRQIAQGPIDRQTLAVGPLLIAEPAKSTPAEKAPPEPIDQLPKLPPAIVKKPEPMLLKSIFGEPTGQGEAEHAAPGTTELRAKHAAPEIQAFLSRDPVGQGKVGTPPTPSTAKPGQDGAAKPGPIRKPQPANPPSLPTPTLTALLPSSASPPPAPVGTPEVQHNPPRQTTEKPAPNIPFGIPSEHVEAVTPKRARHIADSPAMIAQANPSALHPHDGSSTAHDTSDVAARKAKQLTQAPPPPKPAGTPNPPPPAAKPTLIPPLLASTTPPPSLPQVDAGGTPGHAAPSADPAPQSDSEYDAFNKVANIEFSNGRVEAQFGRRIKTVRPKLLLSAQYEIFAQENPRVLLSANVDSTGHVTKAEIYQSSGSEDLDQPCLVALYDWWFEPPKDKHGKPLPDVVVVAITFRNQ